MNLDQCGCLCRFSFSLNQFHVDSYNGIMTQILRRKKQYLYPKSNILIKLACKEIYKGVQKSKKA